jgi:type III restriction enzyme
MSNDFFSKPILNSPYEYPSRHWELDNQGQPTHQIIESRRLAEFITPIPKPKKRKTSAKQSSMVFDEGKGLSTQQQQYDITATINGVRDQVEAWRTLQNSNDWQVTQETARLLQHWRHHKFSNTRPFFCQVEAARDCNLADGGRPQIGKAGERFLKHLADANRDANPELNCAWPSSSPPGLARPPSWPC